MIETGKDAIELFKHLKKAPCNNKNLVFFASQTVDDRVVVYHTDSTCGTIDITFCTLPELDLDEPSSFVLEHATPVKNGSYYTFPLIPGRQWILDPVRKKLIDEDGGVLIGMHSIVSGMSASITCWAMHQDKSTKVCRYVDTVVPIRNMLLDYVGYVGK